MESKRAHGFLDVLKEFAESSTWHGIPKIASSRQLAVKILWCILLIGAFCAVIAQLVSLFTTFRSYPVQTSVSLEFTQLQFPAISFCNMNPVKKSQLKLSPTLRETIYPQRRKNKQKQKQKKTVSREKRDIGVFNITMSGPMNESQLYDIIKKFKKDYVNSDSIKTPTYFGGDTNETFKFFSSGGNETFTFSSGKMFTFFSDHNKEMPKYFNDISNKTLTDFMGDNNVTFTKYETVTYNISEHIPPPPPVDIFPDDNYVYEYWDPHFDEWDSFMDPFGPLDSFDPWDSPIYYEGVVYNETTESTPVFDEKPELFEDPQDKWEERSTRIKTLYRNESLAVRKKMGHQKGDLIQQALFSKRAQNISKYFSHFSSTKYGNCYTLDNTKYRALQSGLEHGIQLTLYLEVDEYIENHSTGYGIRMVFHEPGTFPLPTNEGLTLNPGFETNIGLRAINITRLRDPYGECSDGQEFRKKYNFTYSKAACLEFCRIRKIIDMCECKPYSTPDLLDQVEPSNLPVCKEWDYFDSLCMFTANQMMEEQQDECNCINPCSEFMYQMTISGRAWPNKGYLEKVLMRDLCSKNISSSDKVCFQLKNESEEFNYERYKNSFARILIYFEDLNYEKITEEPFYSTVRFISDIGGAVGLFLGTSLLSLFEILQLLLEIILHLNNRTMTKPTSNGPTKV